MGEVLFYHLTASTLEQTLPDLLERSLARDWRVVVRARSEAQINALDEKLWTYRTDSFLPHGNKASGQVAEQPIFLTIGKDTPNDADILMLVDGARVDCSEVERFQRTCLIFNGHEPEALQAAREDWKSVTNAGLQAKYWAQENGKWLQKA